MPHLHTAPGAFGKAAADGLPTLTGSGHERTETGALAPIENPPGGNTLSVVKRSRPRGTRVAPKIAASPCPKAEDELSGPPSRQSRARLPSRPRPTPLHIRMIPIATGRACGDADPHAHPPRSRLPRTLSPNIGKCATRGHHR